MVGALGPSVKTVRESGLFSLEKVPGTPCSTFLKGKKACNV